ncbi:MAG: pentapeptide repeat-containing protein [Candidatus Caenarcaniphilales bacterium]|nr:pentapeptide repeat-containing protein [Candidatus Caenarcaniphilales bacterium]
MDSVKNYRTALNEYKLKESVKDKSLESNINTVEILLDNKVKQSYRKNQPGVTYDRYAEKIKKNKDGVNRTYYSAKAYLQVHEKVQELLQERIRSLKIFDVDGPEQILPGKQLGTNGLDEIVSTIGNKAKDTVEHINKLLSLNTGDYNLDPINNKTTLAPQLDLRDQKYIEEDLCKELLAPEIKSGNKKLAEKLKDFSEILHKTITNGAYDEQQDFKLETLELAYMTAIELQNIYDTSMNPENFVNKEADEIFKNPQNYIDALDKFIEKNNLSINKEVLHKLIQSQSDMLNQLSFKGKVIAIKTSLDLVKELAKFYDKSEKKNITATDSAKAIKAITGRLTFAQKILQKTHIQELNNTDLYTGPEGRERLDKYFETQKNLTTTWNNTIFTEIILKELIPEQLFPSDLLILGGKNVSINKYLNQEPASLFHQRLDSIEKIREAFRGLDSKEIEVLSNYLKNSIEKKTLTKIIDYEPESYRKPAENWLVGIKGNIKDLKARTFSDNSKKVNWDETGNIYQPASLDSISSSGPNPDYKSPNKEFLLNIEDQIQATLMSDYKLTNKENLLDTKQVKNSSDNGTTNSISINKMAKNFNSPQYINKLIGVHIHDSIIPKAKFDYQNLSGAVLENTNARKASFKYASLIGTEFKHVDLTGADFSNVDLQGVTFKDCFLDKTTWEKAKLNNVHMENCVISDTEINEIDAKSWSLNHCVVNNLKLLGAGTGINIEDLTLLGSLFTNFTIADKDNLILNENGGIVNRDDIRAQKINMDVESLGSIIIGDDQEEKMNVKATALSEYINTPVKHTLTHLVNEYGKQTIEIYSEVNDEEFGFLGMVNLVNNLDNKDLGVRYNL